MIRKYTAPRKRKAQVKNKKVTKNTSSRRVAQPKNSVGMEFRGRGYVVASMLLGVFVWLAINLVLVGVMPVTEPEAKPAMLALHEPLRGNIYDVNGQLLATTVTVRSLYADPKGVISIDEIVEKLQSVLPDINTKKLRKKLNRKARFVWLARKLTPTQAQNINNLGLPALGFKEEKIRMYPQENMMAHVLGGVNGAGVGISGIEKSYNERLAQGEDITLTLDLRLQTQLRESLNAKMKESGAKGASGIVLDPQTGAVSAMVSLPDYDLNHYGSAKPESWQNRATYSLYELGSTFKIFTLAEGLEEEKVTPLTEVDCREPLQIDKFTINDFHAKKKVLTAQEVFRYSSNIGAARIADTFTPADQRAFYRKLNLLEPLDISLYEKGKSLYPHRLGRIYTLSMAYGHGIAVTPMHVAAATGAIVTDGFYKVPYFVEGQMQQYEEQIVKTNTTKTMRNLMRDVVQNGTARNAQVAGYDIGGKTGTAEKNIRGKYVKNKNISSFIGVLPLDNPTMLVSIVLDEGHIKGKSGGGTMAAPVFSDFVRKAAPLIGLLPADQTVAIKKDVEKSGETGKKVKKVIKPVYNKPQTQSPSGAELDEIFRLVAAAN
jgi:cell division protein FtsI (penicillin-binding protein 3)